MPVEDAKRLDAIAADNMTNRSIEMRRAIADYIRKHPVKQKAA
jgi:predicted transcriptional regulator